MEIIVSEIRSIHTGNPVVYKNYIKEDDHKSHFLYREKDKI